MHLSPRCQAFLELMRHAARAYADQRGWGRATQVSLFCPQGAIARLVDVDPSTIRRWFYRYPELRRWIAARPHFTSICANPQSHAKRTHNGRKRTVIDGMVWTVRLREGRGEVRVPIEDLKARYRDLERDIERGQVLHASRKATGVEGLEAQTNLILAWAFDGRTPTPVACDDACSLGDAFAQAEWDETAVEPLVHRIARELRDRHSLRFWRQQVRAWRGRGRLEALKLALERVLTDVAEGFARRPSALLVSRLL